MQTIINQTETMAIQKLRSAYAIAKPTVTKVREVEKTRSVLVIDEDPTALEFISSCLSHREGYKVWKTSDPETANVLIDSINPHLVIADWKSMNQWISQSKIKSLANKVSAILFTFNDSSSFAKLNEVPYGVKIVDCIKKPIAKIEFEAKLTLLTNLLDQFFSLNNQNFQIKSELDKKHRELSLHLELLMHSGSIKDKFVDGISTLQPYLNDEGRSKLRSMIKQFKWALNDEASVNFETAFDDLHSTLYNQLEKRCPKITRNEKRLCAFVVKDHSASDIARIVGKSQNCINVAFARLRAKLKISSNKNLETFLSELQS